MRLGPLWLLALSIGLAADEPRPSVRATGEAVVTARPDRVEIQIGVLTQASKAQTAASQNASKLEAVLAALKRAKPDTLRTVSYSVTPEYTYPREGGQPSISGFRAANVVEVATNDIAAAGSLIDAAMQAGANEIQRLNFTLRDDQPARSEALKQAAAKARASAEAMAASLGVKIVRVLSAESSAGGPPVRPLETMAMARGAGAPTPIESGVIEIRASVTLTLEIAQ